MTSSTRSKKKTWKNETRYKRALESSITGPSFAIKISKK